MMQRSGLALCCFLCAAIPGGSNVHAQVPLRDSLAVVLNALPTDSLRIAACLTGAREDDEALSAAYIALGQTLCLRTQDRVSWAKLTSQQAINANIAGEHEAGAELFLRVDSMYGLMGDPALRAGALTNVGLSYYHAQQYDRALQYYYAADSLYAGETSTGYSRLLNNLAMCLKHTDQLEEAAGYYLKSLSIKRALEDSAGVANTFHNLALLRSVQGHVSEAVAAFDTAIQYYHLLGMTDDEASTNVALGKVLMDAGQFEHAEDHLRSGYQYFKVSAPDSREYQLAASELAIFQMHNDKWSSAEQYIDEALALFPGSGGIADQAQWLELKAEISHHLGKHAVAYDVLQQVLTLKDSLNAEHRMSLITEMQTRFEVRDKENALRLTQVELESQQRVTRLYRIAMMIALVVAGVIGVLGIIIFRSRQEIKRNKRVIEKALAEKEVLLREIHHRVKNNLQVISSLLAMQQFQSRDPNVVDAMREGQSRVHSMALIHQSLYQQESGVELDAGAYVRRLVDSLKQAYRTDVGRIAFHTEAEALRLDVDTMIPLGLILNELITNALKYAFPGERTGHISVVLRKENDAVQLRVKDDGIGMPDPGKLEETDSMGYTLIRDFCRKLKATLEIHGAEGTEVLVSIPLVKSNILGA